MIGKDGVEIMPVCSVCHLRKKPWGRSAPLEMLLCDYDCEGYRQEPHVSQYWSRNEEEFE